MTSSPSAPGGGLIEQDGNRSKKFRDTKNDDEDVDYRGW